MKRTAVLFGISVFAGLGYLAWSQTPLGTTTLSSWLLKKWEEIAAKLNKPIDLELLKKELKKLDYEDHELLARLTWLDPFKEHEREWTEKYKKRLLNLIGLLKKARTLERANLSSLENIVLPG